MTILLVVVSTSQPRRVLTRLSSAMPSLTSFSRKASRTASEIWSETLSGCPSETDSLVNRWLLRGTDKTPPRDEDGPFVGYKWVFQCSVVMLRSRRGLSGSPGWAAMGCLIFVLAGNLLDKIDDLPPKLC